MLDNILKSQYTLSCMKLRYKPRQDIKKGKLVKSKKITVSVYICV